MDSFQRVNLRSLKLNHLADLIREIERARKKYPSNRNLLKSLLEFVRRLNVSMVNHTAGVRGAHAVDVYEQAIIVAALAMRLVDEGDAEFKYGTDQPTGQISLADAMREKYGMKKPAAPLVCNHFYIDGTSDVETFCDRIRPDGCNIPDCPKKVSFGNTPDSERAAGLQHIEDCHRCGKLRDPATCPDPECAYNR